MRLRTFVHKGLKRLYLRDDPAGLPPASVDKIRKILAFLQDIEDPEELRLVPSWKVHSLTGERKGVWSLHVTRNWRITFRVNSEEREIYDLNYEDYH